MHNIIRMMFSRVFLVASSIIIQAITLLLLIWKFSSYFVLFDVIFTVISVIVVLTVMNSKSNPSYKIAWIIPIMIFPIFGGLFFLFIGGNRTSKRNKKRMQEIALRMKQYLRQDSYCINKLFKEDKPAANQSKYIHNYSSCPVYENTYTNFLAPGETFFENILIELKNAKHYIFLEFFIIEEGKMWNSILDILQEKVKEGVDVRVIYDDVGCLFKLPSDYFKKLESMGIKCGVFNRFVPILSLGLNNRDHRKIAIIDGHTGYTGGINIADEYINAVEKFGHWHDSCIVLKGEAVWSFTVMFLSMWDYLKHVKEDFNEFKPSVYMNIHEVEPNGYVQPFNDSPLDDEAVSETVYLNLINEADDYIYIETPYLISDYKMMAALRMAAKRGVDVKIITPHIPDKWYVHAVTRSNYEELIEDGVLIYEYTPGFAHGKTFVVDDIYAVVGTINLDYRSLYLHFECGVWMYKTKSIFEVKKEFLRILTQCEQITLAKCKNTKFYIKLGRMMLKIFAPLM